MDRSTGSTIIETIKTDDLFPTNRNMKVRLLKLAEPVKEALAIITKDSFFHKIYYPMHKHIPLQIYFFEPQLKN
jgi:hypothetical protein